MSDEPRCQSADMGTPASRPVHVMLVDDDVDLLEQLANLLICIGLVVIPASNADEAMAYLENEFCDVLLSDVQMPKISGLELAKWVNDRHPNTQIILTSGQSIAPTELLNSWIYLRKPIDINMLEEIIGGSGRVLPV